MSLQFRIGVQQANRCNCQTCRGVDVTGDRGAHIDRAASGIPVETTVTERLKTARKLTPDELLAAELAKPRPISEDSPSAPRTAASGVVAPPPRVTDLIRKQRSEARRG